MKGFPIITDDLVEAPHEMGELIEHIVTSYHQMHWADLTSHVPLAERVEKGNSDEPEELHGLVRLPRSLASEMEAHMAEEKRILFPAMRAGGGRGIDHPIAVVRADHDDHAESIGQIRRLTPEHANGSWRSL